MKHNITNSYIYELLGLDKTIHTIATEVNPKLDELKLQDIYVSAISSDIKHKAVGVGKEAVLQAIAKGQIIFINAPNVPLTAWCMNNSKGEVVAVCNTYGKVRFGTNNVLSYQVKEVFGLAVIAFIIRSFLVNERKYIFDTNLNINVGIVYSRILMRLLDSMFSVSSIGNERDSVLIEYAVIKFYYRRIIEKQSSPDQETSNILNILRRTRKNGFSEKVLLDDALVFEDKDFESIDSLCKALSVHTRSLGRLETNLLIRKMITTFGEKSVLMLESPQYLIAYTASSAYSANIIRDFQMENIIDNEIFIKIISEVFKISQ